MKKSTRIAPFFLALAFLTIWAACKKSHSSTTDNTPPRVTLITQTSWKYDTAGADTDKDGIVDIGDPTLEPCFKDNIYQFNKDSTGLVDNGPTKCNPTDPQTTPFTWSFSNTGDSVIKSDANPILASGVNIFSMSTTKMVLYKDTSVFGQKIWYVISLKH